MAELSCFPGSYCLVELKKWARYYAITLRWNIWERLNICAHLGLNSRVRSSAMNAEPEQPGRSRGILDSRWFELSKGLSLHVEVLFIPLARTLLSHSKSTGPIYSQAVEYRMGFASLSDLAVSVNSFLLPFIGRCNPDEIQLYLSSAVLIMQCHLLPSKVPPPSSLSDFTCCSGRCSSNYTFRIPNLLAPNILNFLVHIWAKSFSPMSSHLSQSLHNVSTAHRLSLVFSPNTKSRSFMNWLKMSCGLEEEQMN